MLQTPPNEKAGSLKPPPLPVSNEVAAANDPASNPERNLILDNLKSVVALEAQALDSLCNSISDPFYRAVKLLLNMKGKVILTGVGKSGLIARKIAATMNSTGTVATFLHPSDAMHGDLGMLSSDDVVLAIGKSGESDELTQILPAIRRLNVKIIGLTAKVDSTLGRSSDIILHTPIEKEACPLDLAPTVSTTVALAVGDAIAMTLMRLKNFQPEDFAKYHPGGKLGKRLLLKVSDLMIEKAGCPILHPGKASVEDVITALGEYKLGIVLFSEDGKKLWGMLTDGDIRRLLSQHKAKIFDLKLTEVINRTPITTDSQRKAVEVLSVMEERETPLNVLPIVDDGVIVGVARLHDLLSVS